jgi:HTH-type transcriptional regulator/antitoxin HigA
MISVVKSDAQHKAALQRIEQLIANDPTSDSAEGHELEVLAVLIRDYERGAFPLTPPSPLGALAFRMDQLGLAPKDLIPYLGSRSRVSEVLSGKRPLSLAMIRALHSGLRIPLESLVAEAPQAEPTENLEWDRFPIREMVRRGWVAAASFANTRKISFAEARDAMEGFFQPIGGPAIATGVLHKTDSVRTARSSDRFALAAWAAQVLRRAEDLKPRGDFTLADWDVERFRELRGLSRYDVGPRLAIQFLADHGIIVVIEPHLKRTRLDGAAMLRADGTPVIGLTVRHDRLDNFWFTLFHELMHVLLHLKANVPPAEGHSLYLDDLDVQRDISPLETEADSAAREALLPNSFWEMSAVHFVVAPATVTQLARQVGISDAVVAGRVRYERNNYRLLSSMIGAGKVQMLFDDVDWSAVSN